MNSTIVSYKEEDFIGYFRMYPNEVIHAESLDELMSKAINRFGELIEEEEVNQSILDEIKKWTETIDKYDLDHFQVQSQEDIFTTETIDAESR